MYESQLEHDSCGIGMIADLGGRKTHQTVADALTMLANMEHRGACGADPDTGDGAGILIQVPDQFLREVCRELGILLPAAGTYGVGMVFFPPDEARRHLCKHYLGEACAQRGFRILGYRALPVAADAAGIGAGARFAEPQVEQVFVVPEVPMDPDTLERQLFLLRRLASHAINNHIPDINDEFYFTSFSYKTLVYKGQLRTNQLRPYFPDLQDPRVVSGLALVHSRFSTNTFPKWRLAQPFRYIAHNGEINTIRGNVNWMRAKEGMMESSLFTQEELDMLFPICDPRHSDSRNLDSVVELLVMGGRSLPHVMMMLIPEAWQDNPQMDKDRAAFYEYHATLTEPWDGPASICFTDGRIVGATLDRNGLRPSRYIVTTDNRLILASEAGALPVDPATVVHKGRLQPGRILIADLAQGRIISDEELKQDIATRHPYREWLNQYKINLEDLPEPPASEIVRPDADTLLRHQHLFGVTQEELRMITGPLGMTGDEPIGSMGLDIPLAVLSDQAQHLSHYFKQLFAQVSNPPIDPIRERLVMSLRTWIGGSKNIFDESPESCRHIAIKGPVLTNAELHKLRSLHQDGYQAATLYATFDPAGSLAEAVRQLCAAAEAAIDAGATILIISDRNTGPDTAPIPALLATGAVHHHLIRQNLRFSAALITETADAREVHHFATLIGYGAIAVNPYLAFDTLSHLQETHPLFSGYKEAQLHKNFIKAIHKGLLKVFSKMGISTLESYHGSQIFEVLGLNREVVDMCFTGSISRIGGLGFEEIAQEVRVRHRLAWHPQPAALEAGGAYQWKASSEAHLFNPTTIHLLQQATRNNDPERYRQFAEAINQQTDRPITLRSLLDFTPGTPVPLDEVEPIENILKRFSTGAMSFGSISHEAHTTLAIAMNRIGGKSNCGEGGEDPDRYEKRPNGDWERSAIKQVASGRFGVTAHYLAEAAELQIKVAQGAKPGEGGQLPGHKVDAWIGRVRHATPGVGLISPPPHHDIYSIEDLAQLIFDLKNANRMARISVKLVSEAGVGTIAAGVAKAHADHILISGHDGGTGASPLSSIRHAGLPWELGLAEAHQTLVLNNLRSRVTLQVDGQVRTGRDLAIATLLGAEEWSVATAALVTEGCIMMRKCHLNTCPVGIATQNPALRQLFTGKPEHVVNLFYFLAQDLREHMARLGFRTIEEMVGQADRLRVRDGITQPKLQSLDLSRVLFKADPGPGVGRYKQIPQDHGLESVMDWNILEHCHRSIHTQEPTFQSFEITNVDRAVGTLLSHEITRVHKGEGLAPGTIHLKFKGSAGQSFAAFGVKGIRFELEGEANDYIGKGLSGAQVIVYPDKTAPFEPSKNIVIGNVAFYGATSGEAYIRGIAGERFCVRNSGARVVVEGVGDHGCEYMTGGIAIILGKTGRNFAAGMSGGIAYVYDPDQSFIANCNQEMVAFEALDMGDIQTLKTMIRAHHALTGSRVALKIMTDWSAAFMHMVKVMPRDFKAALEKQAGPKLDLAQSA
ncbi:MAG: glutamate synthase large subunit [Bacteroidia bacterium]|nr:glutamate synthase large subunit [Bacteroidia bacterium]